MPDDAAPSASPSASPIASTPTRSPTGVWYSYAIIRLVPRVERGECINVGVVLFSRERRYLAARIALDRERVRAFAPDLDLELVERHLATFLAICDGRREGGPLADLPPAERFHWLVAPRSTVIQTSPAHAGRTADLAAELDRLVEAYVHPPDTTQRQ